MASLETLLYWITVNTAAGLVGVYVAYWLLEQDMRKALTWIAAVVLFAVYVEYPALSGAPALIDVAAIISGLLGIGFGVWLFEPDGSRVREAKRAANEQVSTK